MGSSTRSADPAAAATRQRRARPDEDARTTRPSAAPSLDVDDSPFHPFEQLWRRRHEYGALLLVLVLVHGALFVFDPAPQFFFGDSASYLAAADRYVPRDRSYVYGLIIRALTAQSGDLASLIAFQTSATVAAAFLFGFTVREYFGAGRRASLIAAVSVSVFPLHSVWSRFVMTEQLALLTLGLFVLVALEYLRSGRWFWLLPLQVLGLVAIALRTALIPVVLGSAIVLPVLAVWPRRGATAPRHRQWAHLLLHLGVSIGSMVPLHHAYKADYAARLRWREHLSEAPELAYNHESGEFLASFWAPLLQPEDFPAGIDGAALLADVPALRDPRARTAQHWCEGHLIDLLGRAAATRPGSGWTRSTLSRRVAMAAARRDPVGVLRMGWSTFTGFWDHDYLAGLLRDEMGLQRLPPAPDRERLLDTYAFAIGERTTRLTPFKRAYLALQPYYVALSSVGLVLPAIAMLARRPRRRYAWWLAGVIGYLWAALLLLSSRPCSRFEQPMSWLLWLLVVGVGSELRIGRRDRRVGEARVSRRDTVMRRTRPNHA